MLKKILLIVAMGAALVACSPSGSGASSGASLAPVDTSAPSEAAPSESMPAESASPS